MNTTIGILTAGSDSPGINAAIRAIGKAAKSNGYDILGFVDGFSGLLHDHTFEFKEGDLSGIITAGGTLLGTSRVQPHSVCVEGQPQDQTEQALEVYDKHKLAALVCIGGRETQHAALALKRKGMNVITLPKGIDNSIPGTDTTLGFNTAYEVAAQSIDRLHSTATSHHRIIIVELMGRYAGWLTLAAGLAGGADVILIPEIAYDIQRVAGAIQARKEAGKRFSLIAVGESLVSQEQQDYRQRLRQINAQMRPAAERSNIESMLAKIEDQHTDTTFHVSNQLKMLTGLETRITILGYLLRGGTPSAADRLLATNLGAKAASLACQGQFGVMVASRNGDLIPVPLEDVCGPPKLVPLDHPWLANGRQVGVVFGE